MIKLTIEDGKTYADINDLKLWDRNPRAIKDDRYKELKRRLKKYGLIKPVLCTPDGVMVGGNMRLPGMRDLKWTRAWVSIVEPKNDREMFEMALVDNEELGFYQKEELAALAFDLDIEPIELENFEINLGVPTTIMSIMKDLGPDENDESGEGDSNSFGVCPTCGQQLKEELPGYY